MNTISLQQTLPTVFADRDSITSDIWHKEIVLSKGKKYLVEAASGTGKSSLCGYVYGYRNDYQGIISFDDTNIKAYPAQQWVEIRKRFLSMLFQDLRLFPELTAWENVWIKNNLTGYKKKKEIRSLFDALDVGDILNVKAQKLSYGQQQRVAFIRTLCQPYDFIFLDEPLSHLDDGNSASVSRMLAEEIEKQGAGVIVTSVGRQVDLTYDEVLKL
jgi:ABC-type lipoprotein export system ATPase subunit